MNRKPPYRHPVRSHIRSGTNVSNYVRGHGKPSSNPGKHSGGSGGFHVAFYFHGEPREVLSVPAGTYTGAVRAGLGRMRTPSVPVKVRLGRLV